MQPSGKGPTGGLVRRHHIAVNPVFQGPLDQIQLLDVAGNGGLGGSDAAFAQIFQHFLLGLHILFGDDAQNFRLPIGFHPTHAFPNFWLILS